ncbi:MAG TPA: acylphosphatase [Longimicrobium sp.]|nr:acylphosphatase [Longimicrobium sp.]
MAEAGFRVTGRVQGVGYRWWTRAQATRLGVTGTVRNADDGSVLVQARGSDTALAELERLLGQGPPHARVAQVERVPASLSPRDGVDGLEIVR